MQKIGFAGTDGRTLLWSYVASTAVSKIFSNDFEGSVIRGTPSMPEFTKLIGWNTKFISTDSNSTEDYARAIIQEFQKNGGIDLVVPMPEGLLFDGLVDSVIEAGFGDRILGLTKNAAFIEGDKIRCKELCREARIPVAPRWTKVNAQDYKKVLEIALSYVSAFGGAVLKFPYSAGGKGARIILNAWEIREVYDKLINDYKKDYCKLFGKKNEWPLLIESRMSGVEISFTIFVDAEGHYQILPTAMDYPERFEGPASKTNPITGGTGAISPHPMENEELIEMAGSTIVEPLIEIMKEKCLLRPCILYPGCFVSFDSNQRPVEIRVCEINIRPGEPEAQPVARRIKNFGALLTATMEGKLDEVYPEVRDDQISICIALMTGKGGPQGQKGYPWSCTKGEKCEIDTAYMKKKGIWVIPSALDFIEEENLFKSDGTRVAFLSANATVKEGKSCGEQAEVLRNKLYAAFDNGKIRVIPRENDKGNRLDLRRDIGRDFLKAEELFLRS